MFDPVSLGIAAASLVAKKALEKFGESAGQEAGSALELLRERLASWLSHADEGSGKALERVEASPDSALSVKALADAIAIAAGRDPEGAAKVAELIEELQPGSTAAGGASFNLTVRDNGRIGTVNQAGRDVNARNS